MHLPASRGEQEIVLLGAGRTPTMPSPGSSFMAILPDLLTCTKSDKLVAPHVARFGGEDHIQLVPLAFVLGQRPGWR